jgi:hypothetical protein
MGKDVIRIRQFLEVWKVSRYEPVEVGSVVAALIQRRVTHQVHDRAMLLESSPVEIATVLDADKIGYLDWEERA